MVWLLLVTLLSFWLNAAFAINRVGLFQWPLDIDYFVLAVGAGHATSTLNRRQLLTAAQNNISDTFIPPTTQRWTLSIEAQIQEPSQQGSSQPKCTLQICLGSGTCGTAKTLTGTWSTVNLVTRLTANETQTVIFVNLCSGPANVALRSMRVPGRFLAVTTTAVRTVLASTLPRETQTVTMEASTVVSTFYPPESTVEPQTSSTSETPSSQSSLTVTVGTVCLYEPFFKCKVPWDPVEATINPFSVNSFTIYSSDPSVEFARRGSLCADVPRLPRSIRICGIDTIKVNDLRDQDTVRLSCPNGPVQSIPLRIQTGPSCRPAILQIDCESTSNLCRPYGIVGGETKVLDFPKLSPMPQFRFTFSQFTTAFQWRYDFGGDPYYDTQANSEWMGFTVPGDAELINMYTTCTPGSVPEPELEQGFTSSSTSSSTTETSAPRATLQISVVNNCGQEPPFSRGATETSTGATLNPGASESLTLYADDPSVVFVRGGSLCVRNQRNGYGVCGSDSVTIRDLQDQDALELTCPPPPRTSFTFSTSNGCQQQPPFTQKVPWTSLETTLNPGASGTSMLYSDDPRVLFERPGSICVNLLRDGSRSCGGNSVVTGQLQNQDVIELECPGPTPDVTVSLINNCQDQPAFSQRVPWDPVVRALEPGLTGTIMLLSSDPWVEFARTGEICVTNQRDGRRFCASDLIRLEDLQDQDSLVLECPEPETPPPRPMLRLSVTNACAQQPPFTHETDETTFPPLDPGAFREYSVYADHSGSTFTWPGYMCLSSPRYGTRFQRICDNYLLGVYGLQDQDTIELSCPVPITAAAFNGCSGDQIMLEAPSRPNSVIINPGDTANFITFLHDPIVVFTPQSGRRTCAISGFTEDNVACGTSAFTFGRIIDGDSIQLVCP